MSALPCLLACLIGATAVRAAAFSLAKEGDALRVETAGLKFVLPEKGRFALVENGRQQALFAHNIRVSGPSGPLAAYFDFADDRVTVVEETAVRIVLRAERSLGLNDWLRGVKTPWSAARMTLDYVFARDVPGVIVVERMKASEPYGFISWNIVCCEGYSRYAIDGTGYRTYPTRKEFLSQPGGYRTKAGAFVAGESPDGRRWFMGREFEVFAPRGDGKPGAFLASCDTVGARQGTMMPSGSVVSASLCLGRLRTPEDVATLRAFRAGGGALPVAAYAGDWQGVPVAAWRGETKDYRPLAGLNWNGRNDLSFVLRLAHAAHGLRARVEVTDDIVRNAFAGKDAVLGDSAEFVFADARGEQTLVRVVSANAATRTADGYAAEIAVSWEELSAAGLDRARGMRFNVCVTDQDKGTDCENWMGVADGIKGGRDPRQYPFLDFAGVRTTYAPEREVLPDKAALQAKIDAVKAANAALPAQTDDAYSASLRAMTDYFLDFMQKDLDCGDTVRMGHRVRRVDDAYRHYMNDRINKNADCLTILQRELKARQDDLASGRVQPMKTVTYPKGVRPVIADGGFKANGREILLIGPDTWTNVSGWRNDDIGWIAAMGFNQLNCFYIGGTNYADVVRRTADAGLYGVWGAAFDTAEDLVNRPDPRQFWPAEKQNAFRNGMGFFLGSLVPSNPPPHFVFQVSFPEQWTRKHEATEAWAQEFRAHLERRFGSLAAMNAALGTDCASWTNVDFAAALGSDALKYESFRCRMEANIRRNRPNQDWIARRFGLPRSTHYSTHCNIAGLDPLVVLADFEAHWSQFDIIGFDGGFGLGDNEWAFDFPKGGVDYDLARSCSPEKPVANNENHVVVDGTYLEHSNEVTYLSNMLAFLMGQNSSSVWEWANTRHTYGEYVFTRANTCHELVRCALDVRRYPEEIAAFRRAPDPPFRIFHSLPSFAERDPYVRSLYALYGACSFTGWATRFLTERQLAKGELAGAKETVVPDARRVSDGTFAALADFAARGGIVLVDGNAALTKDPWGKPVPALWRTAETPDGRRVAFVTNLAKTPVTVRIPGPGADACWTELLAGRAVAGEVALKPLDVLLLAEAKGSRENKR